MSEQVSRATRGERRTGRGALGEVGLTAQRLRGPEGATGINVSGKRLASPIQGFGKMWQKTYQVRLPSSQVSAVDVISTWKVRFPEFWPKSNHFYAPLTGIAPGEVALVEGTLPGRLKLSTGVMVLYADDESFTLMTPQGHMFAGWITFSATEQGDETVAQAQVLMRASDPVFEIGMVLGGHRQENRIWDHTLTSLAAHFGVAGRRGRDGRDLRGQEAAVAALDQHLALVGDPVDALHAQHAVPGAAQGVAPLVGAGDDGL